MQFVCSWQLIEFWHELCSDHFLQIFLTMFWYSKTIFYLLYLLHTNRIMSSKCNYTPIFESNSTCTICIHTLLVIKRWIVLIKLLLTISKYILKIIIRKVCKYYFKLWLIANCSIVKCEFNLIWTDGYRSLFLVQLTASFHCQFLNQFCICWVPTNFWRMFCICNTFY